MKTRNRALSILLCVVMLLALMPSALAAESMPQSGNTENRCFRCEKLLLGFSNRGLKREKQKDPGDFLTKIAGVYLVDLKGFEPSTPTMRMWCAPNCATSPSHDPCYYSAGSWVCQASFWTCFSLAACRSKACIQSAA